MAIYKLIVIRHDRSRGNQRNVVQGLEDPELQRGYKRRTEELTDRIVEGEGLTQHITPLYVFCSKMKRSYYTAQWMHSYLAIRHEVMAALIPSPYLNERGQGVLDGLPYEAVVEYLRPILPPGTLLTPDSKNVYAHLFLRDDIEGAEKQENLKTRLERFAVEELQLREGNGIIVGHGVSIMNGLLNLLTVGDILGNSEYRHYENLAGVRLELESFGRYRQTGIYNPPKINDQANGRTNPRSLDKMVIGT